MTESLADQGLMEMTAEQTASFTLGGCVMSQLPPPTSELQSLRNTLNLSSWIYSLCYTCLKFHVTWEESICRAIILGMFLFHSVLTQLLPQYGRTPGTTLKILPGINTEVYYKEKSRSPAVDSSSAGQSYLWKTLHRTRASHIFFEDDYCIFTIVLIGMSFSYLSLNENNIRFPFFIVAKFT